MYPMRGAVTWKSTAGTNVAADALSNLASGGVTGGAMIIIGEDYGEGSSIMQERSHAFALKSQIWLLDPRPEPADARAHGRGRLRTVRGLATRRSCSKCASAPATCMASSSPRTTQAGLHAARGAGESARATSNRIVLPPASFLHEKEKLERRWPAAVEFVKSRKLNELFGPTIGDVGVIMLGGMYNTTMRALQYLGLADAYGETPCRSMCSTSPIR